MAFCTWMMATLVGAAWALASAANPRTSAGKTTKFLFKLETPKCENTTIMAPGGLKRPADRKAEHRPLFKIRVRLAESGDRVGECIVVRKERAVGYDWRLQKLPND